MQNIWERFIPKNNKFPNKVYPPYNNKPKSSASLYNRKKSPLQQNPPYKPNKPNVNEALQPRKNAPNNKNKPKNNNVKEKNFYSKTNWTNITNKENKWHKN